MSSPGGTVAGDLRRTAVAVLVDPGLESLVEMVLASPAPDVYEARSVDGFVRFRRRATAGGWAFDVDAVEGRAPLGDQDPTRFAPLHAELAARFPDRRANSYPYAWELR